MGKRKNSVKDYKHLSSEEMYTHIRKNISIPKYMDLFLYENNISLSKLVQNAITLRMEQTQRQSLKKEIEQSLQHKTIRKKINEKQKENPQFTQELQRARLLLTQYFQSFDEQNDESMNLKKQLIFSDFPEMYVDILKFEQWYQQNHDLYTTVKNEYENPVERLIAIKKEFFK